MIMDSIIDAYKAARNHGDLATAFNIFQEQPDVLCIKTSTGEVQELFSDLVVANRFVEAKHMWESLSLYGAPDVADLLGRYYDLMVRDYSMPPY